MEESEDEVEADGAHVKQNRHNIEENDDDVERPDIDDESRILDKESEEVQESASSHHSSGEVAEKTDVPQEGDEQLLSSHHPDGCDASGQDKKFLEERITIVPEKLLDDLTDTKACLVVDSGRGSQKEDSLNNGSDQTSPDAEGGNDDSQGGTLSEPTVVADVECENAEDLIAPDAESAESTVEQEVAEKDVLPGLPPAVDDMHHRKPDLRLEALNDTEESSFSDVIAEAMPNEVNETQTSAVSSFPAGTQNLAEVVNDASVQMSDTAGQITEAAVEKEGQSVVDEPKVLPGRIPESKSIELNSAASSVDVSPEVAKDTPSVVGDAGPEESSKESGTAESRDIDGIHPVTAAPQFRKIAAQSLSETFNAQSSSTNDSGLSVVPSQSEEHRQEQLQSTPYVTRQNVTLQESYQDEDSSDDMEDFADVLSSSAAAVANNRHDPPMQLKGLMTSDIQDCSGGNEDSLDGAISGDVVDQSLESDSDFQQYKSSLNGSNVCNVCGKDFLTEQDMIQHKKRHKVSDPFVCPYCRRQYIDKNRYDIHIRLHTGETPYKCHLCGKGFRDERKMNLHIRRHTSSLGHKCHLCPRSFEGGKALQKHLQAHKNNRYVAPKVFKKADGSVTMALAAPDVGLVVQKPAATLPPQDASAIQVMPQQGVADTGKVEAVAVVSLTPEQLAAASAESEQVSLDLASTSDSHLPCDTVGTAVGEVEEDNTDATISLSMDELIQYAQPLPAPVIQQHGGDLEDRLIEGVTRCVPVGMEEFMTDAAGPSSGSRQSREPVDRLPEKAEEASHDDSGEFPDLLGTDSDIASLECHKLRNETKFEKQPTVRDESGLTFATLSGVSPEYPENKSAPVIVARKSPAPKPGQVSEKAQTSSLMNAIASEAVAQLAKANISLPAGTCLVPANANKEGEEKSSQVTRDHLQILPAVKKLAEAAAARTGADMTAPRKSMTITIQYKIYPDPQGQPQRIAVKRDLSDLINEAPPERSDVTTTDSSASSTPVPPPILKQQSSVVNSPTPSEALLEQTQTQSSSSLDPSKIPPIDVEPSGPDPAKDTRVVITASGNKYDVPTIVTGGYDLDNLLCTFCNRAFKNDKTLMGHMLNHFGVTPKMANCPVCGLTLQKKSYARHLRLHGNVIPEVCPYCQKGFREKRSLDKHIKAIHHAERPFTCDYCPEKFRNQVEQKAHINRHIKDYPYKCEICSMTFQKQDSLTTHYRLHTGEKPFVCEICDKTFTSEKNKRIHVLRHQGSWPHKCDVCNLTFQQRTHLIKHAASHTRKTQVIQAKINTFLESFSASLENDMLGLDDDNFTEEQKIPCGTNVFEPTNAYMGLPDENSLEAAAAEAAFMLGQSDLTEELLEESGTEDVSESNIPELRPGELLQCHTCDKRLSNRKQYIIHVKQHAQRLKCPLCQKVFIGKTQLEIHLKTHDNRKEAGDIPQIKPPTAEEVGSSIPAAKADASSHMREKAVSVETIKCALCPETFTDNESLQNHTQIHFKGNANEKIIDGKLLRQKIYSKKRPKRCRYLVKVQRLAPVMWHGFTYQCKLCDESLSSLSSRAIHKITKHGGKSWKCRFCSVLFRNRPGLKDHLLSFHKTDKEEIQMLGILKDSNIFTPVKKPYRPMSPVATPPPPIHPSVPMEAPMVSTVGGAQAVTVPTDDNLTCFLCQKSFKTKRAFKLHRDRHQGLLNHKCPMCVKTFNGRSEVNRHMVSVHGRMLMTNEPTLRGGGAPIPNAGAASGEKFYYDSWQARNDGAKVVASISLPAEMSQENMEFEMVRAEGHQVPLHSDTSSTSRCSTSLSDRGSLTLSEQGVDLVALPDDSKLGDSEAASAAAIQEQKEKLIAMMAQKITARCRSKDDDKARSKKSKKDKHKKKGKSSKSSKDSEAFEKVLTKEKSKEPEVEVEGSAEIQHPVKEETEEKVPPVPPTEVQVINEKGIVTGSVETVDLGATSSNLSMPDLGPNEGKTAVEEAKQEGDELSLSDEVPLSGEASLKEKSDTDPTALEPTEQALDSGLESKEVSESKVESTTVKKDHAEDAIVKAIVSEVSPTDETPPQSSTASNKKIVPSVPPMKRPPSAPSRPVKPTPLRDPAAEKTLITAVSSIMPKEDNLSLLLQVLDDDPAREEVEELESAPEELEPVEEAAINEDTAESPSRDEGSPKKEEDEQPVEDDKAADETMEEKSIEEIGENKSMKEATEDKSVNEAAEDKSIKKTAEDKSVEDKSVEEAVEDKSAKEAVEDKSVIEAVEDKSVKEAVEDKSVKETVEDKSVEETVEDKSVEETVEDKSVEETVEDKSVEQTEEDKSAEETTEDKSVEESTEDKSVHDAAETKEPVLEKLVPKKLQNEELQAANGGGGTKKDKILKVPETITQGAVEAEKPVPTVKVETEEAVIKDEKVPSKDPSTSAGHDMNGSSASGLEKEPNENRRRRKGRPRKIPMACPRVQDDQAAPTSGASPQSIKEKALCNKLCPKKVSVLLKVMPISEPFIVDRKTPPRNTTSSVAVSTKGDVVPEQDKVVDADEKKKSMVSASNPPVPNVSSHNKSTNNTPKASSNERDALQIDVGPPVELKEESTGGEQLQSPRRGRSRRKLTESSQSETSFKIHSGEHWKKSVVHKNEQKQERLTDNSEQFEAAKTDPKPATKEREVSEKPVATAEDKKDVTPEISLAVDKVGEDEEQQKPKKRGRPPKQKKQPAIDEKTKQSPASPDKGVEQPPVKPVKKRGRRPVKTSEPSPQAEEESFVPRRTRAASGRVEQEREADAPQPPKVEQPRPVEVPSPTEMTVVKPEEGVTETPTKGSSLNVPKRRGRPPKAVVIQEDSSVAGISNLEDISENASDDANNLETTSPADKANPVSPVTPKKTEKNLPDNTNELMKQKGVTVTKDGKLMIPSHRLTLSPELCKVVEGKGKKFSCQVCHKTFLRKDKINYHIYSEHHDEFLRLGGQELPSILKKGDSPKDKEGSIQHRKSTLLQKQVEKRKKIMKVMAAKNKLAAMKEETDDADVRITRNAAAAKDSETQGQMDEAPEKDTMPEVPANAIMDYPELENLGIIAEQLQESLSKLRDFEKTRVNKKILATEKAELKRLKSLCKPVPRYTIKASPKRSDGFKLTLLRRKAIYHSVVKDQLKMLFVIAGEGSQEPLAETSRKLRKKDECDTGERDKTSVTIADNDTVKPSPATSALPVEKRRGRPRKIPPREPQNVRNSQDPGDVPLKHDEVPEPTPERTVLRSSRRTSAKATGPAEAAHVTTDQTKSNQPEEKSAEVMTLDERIEAEETPKKKVKAKERREAAPGKATKDSVKEQVKEIDPAPPLVKRIKATTTEVTEDPPAPVEKRATRSARVSQLPPEEVPKQEVEGTAEEKDASLKGDDVLLQQRKRRGRPKKQQPQQQQQQRSVVEEEKAIEATANEGQIPSITARNASEEKYAAETQVKSLSDEAEMPKADVEDGQKLHEAKIGTKRKRRLTSDNVKSPSDKVRRDSAANASEASGADEEKCVSISALSDEAHSDKEKSSSSKLLLEEKENSAKPLKLVIKHRMKRQEEEAKESTYVVHSSEDNPLKLKLRPEKPPPKDSDEDGGGGLKVRLVLGPQASGGGQEGEDGRGRHKKHKKKDKKALVLRIKSPRSSSTGATGEHDKAAPPITHTAGSNVTPDDNSLSRVRRGDGVDGDGNGGGDSSKSSSYLAATGQHCKQREGGSDGGGGNSANRGDVSSSSIGTMKATNVLLSSSSSASALVVLVPSDMGDREKDQSRPGVQCPPGDAGGHPPPASFSPDASPPIFGSPGTDEEEEEPALPEGTIKDLIKIIEDSDPEENPPPLRQEQQDSSQAVPPTSSATCLSSQVDGSTDALSRASSLVSAPSSPSPSSDEEKPSKTSSTSRPPPPRDNVIQQRMKQTQQTTRNLKPKSKLALIRRVFSTYTKSRKIVVVKYRKPESRIFSLEEYHERKAAGSLDIPYDEDVDDPTIVKMKTPAKKGADVMTKRPTAIFYRSGSWDERQQMEEQKKRMRSTSESPEEGDDLGDGDDCDPPPKQSKLQCPECSRILPNLVRMHAHKQMHLDAAKRKQRSKGPTEKAPLSSSSSASSPSVSYDDCKTELIHDAIAQLDGETGIDLVPSSTTASSTSSSTPSIPYQTLSSASSNGHTVIVTTGVSSSAGVMMSSAASTGSPSQTPTHVLILKSGVAQPTSLLRPVSNVSVVSPFSKSQSASSHQQSLCVVKSDTSSSSSSRESSSTSPNALPLFAKELLSSDHAHPMLIKQDPILVASSSGGGIVDKDQSQSQDRLILPDALQLFEDDEHMPLEANDSTIHLSIDDIAHFAQPMTTSSGLTADGSHASFDTSLETSSFLSDIASETTNGTVSLPEIRSDSGTPSLPDEGEFPCSQCDKKFGNRRNLTSHMRRHTGDYKIYCDDCGKGFFTQSKLDSHKRKHTGEKPFRCLMKTCMKRFRYKGDLAKHIRRYHPGHQQELVPIPLQPDELLTLQATVKRPPASVISGVGLATANSTTNNSLPQAPQSKADSLSFFFPLLPQHPVKPSELSPTSFTSAKLPLSATHQQQEVSDDNDPSLDESLLDILTQDDPPVAASTPTGFTSSSSSSTPILHDVLTKGNSAAVSTTTTFVAPAITSPPKKQRQLLSPPLPPPPPPPPPLSVSTQALPHRTTVSGITFSLPTQPTRLGTGTPLSLATVSLPVITAPPPKVELPTEPASLAATSLLPTRPMKAYQCDHEGCNRSFEKPTLLRRHLKLHSGNCKFVCDVCQKCFESQSKIDDHYRKHTGEKPFACEVCGNTFRYKGDRTKHLKNLHGITKSTPRQPPPATSTTSANPLSSANTTITTTRLFTSDSTKTTITSAMPKTTKTMAMPTLTPVRTITPTSTPISASTAVISDIKVEASSIDGGDDSNSAQETVTMSLEEVMQFAQPVATDYFSGAPV